MRIVPLALITLALPALARADHIKGIRISPPVTVGVNTVQFNVTIYTSDPLTPPLPGTTTGMGTNTTFNGVTYAVPAIRYGDPGDTLDYLPTGQGLVLVSDPNTLPRVYRRSFTHTYPNGAQRTISVATECCGTYGGGPAMPGQFLVTANGFRWAAINTAVVFPGGVPALPVAGLIALTLLLLSAGAWLVGRAHGPGGGVA